MVISKPKVFFEIWAKMWFVKSFPRNDNTLFNFLTA